MPTELTRAREIITELEINSKELLAEYFTKRKFEAGIEYLKKRKWRDFADVLEKEEEILNELAKVWVFGKDTTAEILDDILKFYRERTKHDFKEIITKLDKKTNFTHTEKALFVAINDTHFFRKCYDMLSIHAHDGVVYESYDGKKDVKITDENCQNLEITIGEYAHKQYKAGKHCKVFKDEFCEKWIFTVNTHKGAKNQPHWENKEINNEKIIPAVQTNIIYEPKTGRVEIGLFKSRSKTFIVNIIELFGENVLKSKIDISKTPKVYNLRKIQKSIEKDGDFYFTNTQEVSISIRQISYSQSGIFRVLYRKQHSQASFLKQVQSEGLLKYNTLEKVQMVVKYKEGTKTKSREFFIELGKTNLSHDNIDTKIRYILRESGVQEITVFDVKNAFEYVITNNGFVNIYKAEKQGYEKQAFEILIESELLCVEGDVENLFCEVCKMDTMEVGEVHATCTNCGCVVYLHEVDATNYKLNFQKLKEKLCEYKDLIQDENSKEPSYIGYLKYGESGKINFHIVENAKDVQNIKKWGEQIVLYIYGECKKENEKDLNAFPIIDYLSFGNHKIVGFDKGNVEGVMRGFNESKPQSIKLDKEINDFIYQYYTQHYKDNPQTFSNKEDLANEIYSDVIKQYPKIKIAKQTVKDIGSKVRTKLNIAKGRPKGRGSANYVRHIA